MPGTIELRNHPDVRHAFERASGIHRRHQAGGRLILRRNPEVAFIGSKGIGKSTAICKATGLKIPRRMEALRRRSWRRRRRRHNL